MGLGVVMGRWSRPRVRPAAGGAVLATYSSPAFLQRHRKKLLTLLLFLTLIYGAAFGLTTTYFLLQLTVPLVLLAAAVIWLLPESEAAPVGMMSTLFFAFFMVLLIWPDYLAITLPGMPWITAVRLIGAPLAFALFVCLSTSAELRVQMAETLAATPSIWKMLTVFAVIVLLSVGWSTDPRISSSKLVIALINWFLIFFVSVHVFRQQGSLLRFAYMLWGIAILVSLIGVQEWRHSQVPWAGHIPSFLAVQDETVQRILAGSSRAATKIYRVQSKFTTSLALAEFYALTVPFIMHFAFNARRTAVKVAAAATLPFLFWMILRTDSRLGVVGFFLAGILYLAVWAAWRWRRNADSIIAPAILLTYPLTFALFIASTFFVRRLRAIVWGSGAQAASDESRMAQVVGALPKVGQRPWGYGIGRGGDTLGFANGNGIMTIDSYYLTIVLEYGIIGLVVYYGVFVSGIWNGTRRLWMTNDRETDLIAPVTIALINFVVIKAIFSQQDNHALAFAFLGALVALCWRIDAKTRAAS